MRWVRYVAAAGGLWLLSVQTDQVVLIWIAALVLFVLIRQEEGREK